MPEERADEAIETIARWLIGPARVAFAGALGHAAPALGRFSLKGFDDPQEVFGPPLGARLPELQHG
jgi:hypothetical protein